ncbi:MAG: potassium transporter Kup [Alphaproteobacteria bacterium]
MTIRSADATARPGTLGLTLLALGVVYGDIGTSPIYTIGLFFADAGFRPVAPDVLGALSLVVWALTIVVTIKYVVVILIIDNRGEGGIMALLALALRTSRGKPARRHLLVAAGLLGAALFFAEGVITPAISVLSAVEGLEVAAPRLAPFVVPIAAGILTALFAFQSQGTARVGVVFGPIILVWFATLTVLGVRAIAAEPSVLAALNPVNGLRFLVHHQLAGLASLGIVVLAVTGAEALYADLGHFGKTPIRLGWLAVAYPALIVNYLGQGALILHDPEAAEHPFFLMAPDWALYPLIGLTTFATIIASQATISGAFSVARQAVQLGYLPRLRTVHTSARIMGQVYVPRVNLIMFVAVLALVFWFGSSGAIAAAYGVAVTGTFMATVVLAASVYLHRRLLPVAVVLPLFGAFFVVDLTLFLASTSKLASGAFLPITAGIILYFVMTTWSAGRTVVARRRGEAAMPLDGFLERVTGDHPPRVEGTAVYLTAAPNFVPHALLHNLKHNKVLHERVVVLSVATEDVPRVDEADRIVVTPVGKRFYLVELAFGFFETPDVPAALARAPGLDIDVAATSFFLGRDKLVPSVRPSMSGWRERLFLALARNAETATDYFRLPPNRVVELGAVLEL